MVIIMVTIMVMVTIELFNQRWLVTAAVEILPIMAVSGEKDKHLDNENLLDEISKLSVELQLAKETIADLQNQLGSRETELRITKDKQHASFRRHSRRRKISMAFLNPSLAKSLQNGTFVCIVKISKTKITNSAAI